MHDMLSFYGGRRRRLARVEPKLSCLLYNADMARDKIYGAIKQALIKDGTIFVRSPNQTNYGSRF